MSGAPATVPLADVRTADEDENMAFDESATVTVNGVTIRVSISFADEGKVTASGASGEDFAEISWDLSHHQAMRFRSRSSRQASPMVHASRLVLAVR